MRTFFYTSASGWMAAILIGVEILLPYLLRRTALSQALNVSGGYVRPYLERMKVHYWLGYVVLVLCAAHAWIPMQAGYAGRANGTGLWFATIALFLLLFQTSLGIALQSPSTQGRRIIRGWHYWIMIAVVIFGAAHIWLNS